MGIWGVTHQVQALCVSFFRYPKKNIGTIESVFSLNMCGSASWNPWTVYSSEAVASDSCSFCSFLPLSEQVDVGNEAEEIQSVQSLLRT